MEDNQQYPPPSAPPRRTVGAADPPPPSYDAVREQDEHRRLGAGSRVANTLTSSMAFAGKFVIHKITVLFHYISGAVPDNATRSFNRAVLQRAR